MNNLNNFIFKHFVYYPIAIIKTSEFQKNYKKLMESQYKTEEWLYMHQLKSLKAIKNYTYKNVNYYKKYDTMNINNELNLDDCLNNLPLITKSELKISARMMQSSQKFRFVTRKTTGGSTGQPVTLLKNREAMAKELAATWRGYSWAGIDIGNRQMRFWGVPFSKKDKIKAGLTDFVCNRKRVSAFSFDKGSMRKYTETINKFNPLYYYGYLSMIKEYAEYIRDYGGLKTNPNKIIVTSEVLIEEDRLFIEDVFDCKVYNEYGCGEVGSIAHECENGSMHISAENMIVEILNDGKSCQEGEVGEIVVTELNNMAMPLIRYKLGDFGSISRNKCPCGRILPVLEKIHGREYDIVITKDGRKFHGEFFMYIFEEAKRNNYGIDKFKVIQEDFLNFTVQIIPSVGYQRVAEELIISRFKEGLGSEVKIRFELVEKIEREKSGKYRVVEGMKDTSSRNILSSNR